MPSELTDEQARIVKAESNFLLLACPGSGKTRSAAARIAHLDSMGLRVASCSYTNVGADRIASMLSQNHAYLVTPRHFNGTLHGLLLRYVVYPFAHLLGAKTTVKVWEGSWPDFGYQGDPKRRIRLDQFRRAPDGSLIFAKPDRWVGKAVDEVCANVEQQVLNFKGNLFRSRGMVSADDAMWVALRILREYTELRKVIAGRFDEILIDEAQDTSELQLACVAEIRMAGLESLVMVGDLEQSIFAFQGASAEGCRQLAEDCKLRTEEFEENHRSSQKLCDVAAHFSGRGADKAVGVHRDCSIEPELFHYPVDEPIQAMDYFRERLKVHGLDIAGAAVLARRHKMVARLGGQEEVVQIQRTPLAIGRLAAALTAGTLGRTDVRRAEALIAEGAFEQNPAELDPEVRRSVLVAAHAFIGDLAPLEGDLRTWIIGARAAYDGALSRATAAPKKKGSHMVKAGSDHKDYAAADAFVPAPADLRPQTVHSLKGEERDAVMVVVSKHSAGDPAKQMQLIEASFEGAVGEELEEERRITYVALTRAERFCLLALPDDAKGRAVASRCEEIGFAVP